jgi:hypothetical protein
VSGKLTCVAGALLVARLLPGFREQHVAAHRGPENCERVSEAALASEAAGVVEISEATEVTDTVEQA